MENLLLLLPDRSQSVVVRYLLTTLIVGICFLLQVGVEMQSGFFGFFLLLPGIFIASLIFDRGSGFYATVLSTALSVLVLMRPGGGFVFQQVHNILADVPPENVMAMFDAVIEVGAKPG